MPPWGSERHALNARLGHLPHPLARRGADDEAKAALGTIWAWLIADIAANEAVVVADQAARTLLEST